jgi:2-iminoacetate synthase
MNYSQNFLNFVSHLDSLPRTQHPRLQRFASLLENNTPKHLESLAHQSLTLTRRQFGNTMRLFAPIYLSNECVNNCQYCGFSRDNTAINRVTLSIDQVVQETQFLANQGFRNILLVAGEHPKFVSNGYLENCIRAIRELIPSISIEVGPMESHEYQQMVNAGAEGLIVYQETYDRQAYSTLHTAGPKKDYDWRLECPDRGIIGGFRRIGIGALFGLSDWRLEALKLAAHLDYLYKHGWKTSYTVAFPRLRPAAGLFKPLTDFPDWALLQTLCAFRLTFPEVGIILSTRESATLRDSLAPLGITHMSAGSHTEPGGYTGVGTEDLHQTIKGKRIELSSHSSDNKAEGQFNIADERSPAEVATMLKHCGLDPVWKDWDTSLLENSSVA